jgi:autotransporter-associated beta strand protein
VISGGSQIFSGNNTYTGTTTISAGTLQIGNGGATGTLGTGAVTDNGALIFNRSNAMTVENVISGSGSLTQAGIGTTILTGINTYSRGTTVRSGILQAGSTTAFGSGSITVASGATLDLNSQNMTSTGTLTLNGSGISNLGALTNSSGSLATYAGAVNLTADSILGGTGAINVSGTLTSNGYTLVLVGSGAKTLNSDSNTLSTIATGSNLGALSLVNNSSLTVGSITLGGTTYSGVNSSGIISLSTITGDLTVANNILTTNSTDSAVVLVAGSTMAAGTATGGNIIWSGSSTPTLTVGSGGRATLYTGSISDSTGITTLVGSGSGNFRYNSTQSTRNYILDLGTGIYAIYREQPTLTITANTPDAIPYGTAAPSYTSSVSGARNGDTASQALSTQATVTDDGIKSTSGYLTAADHTLTASGAVDQLGYALSYATGSLTVNQRALNVTGLTASNRVYNASTVATLGGTATVTPISGDVVIVGGSASGAFADQNAGTDKAITVIGVTISGVDAGNYNLVQQAGLTATINTKALSITAASAADKTYDGSTSATVTMGTLSGFVGNETVTASAQGNFNTKNAGTDKTVTVNYTLANGSNGGLASNYSLADSSAIATISPASITIDGATNTVTYNGSNQTNTGAMVSINNGQSSLITTSTIDTGIGTDRFVISGYGVGTNVGTYSDNFSLAPVGSTLASNYSIAYTNRAITIAQLQSVTYIGAAGGNWSDASNWAGGAIPTLGNVGTVIIPSGKAVVYDAANLSNLTPTSAITDNGMLSFTGASAITFANNISGSGSISQSGSGALTLTGSNTYSGGTTIASGSTLFAGSNSALGTGTLISSGGSFGVISGIVLPSLTVDGNVALISDISTVGDQTYNGAISLANASSITSSLTTLSSSAGSINFVSTIKAGASNQSLTLSALAGDITFDDQVGVATQTYNSSTGTYSAISDSSYQAQKGDNLIELVVSAKTININADITTSGTQTYNGAILVGNNNKNGSTRHLISQDPAVTINGTINDVTSGTHGLTILAVTSDAALTPVITVNEVIGDTAPLATLTITTSSQLETDSSQTVGQIIISENVTTTGSQAYTANRIELGNANESTSQTFSVGSGSIAFEVGNGSVSSVSSQPITLVVNGVTETRSASQLDNYVYSGQGDSPDTSTATNLVLSAGSLQSNLKTELIALQLDASNEQYVGMVAQGDTAEATEECVRYLENNFLGCR